jgi:hypothetical protein
MAAWLFTAAAWMLLLAGVFVAWRFGWRDPGKGTRRCPKCWYDMSATSGLKCSECGREAGSERRLHRRRRRRRWFAVGVLIASSSWVPFKWPEYERLRPLGDAWLAFLPKTSLAAGWPLLLRWKTASAAHPSAWWAIPNAIGYLNVSSLIETKRLWAWQEWLKLRSCAVVFRSSTDTQEITTATDLMRFASEHPTWLVDAYMARLVDPSRNLGVGSSDAFIAIERKLDHKWATPLLHAFETQEYLLSSFDRGLFWLSTTGVEMDSLVPLLSRNSLGRETKISLASSLAYGNITQTSRREVARLLARQNSFGVPTLLPLHIARIISPDAETIRPLSAAIEARDVYASILACASVAEAGVFEPTVVESLREVASGSDRPNRRAARIALATLAGDDVTVRDEASALIDFLRTEKSRDKRMYEVTVLYEFARRRLLADDLAIEGLVAVVDAEQQDNWMDVGNAGACLVELRADVHPGVRALLRRQIELESSAGYFTLLAYIKRGDAPREVLDAGRRLFIARPEPQRSRGLRDLGAVRPSD